MALHIFDCRVVTRLIYSYNEKRPKADSWDNSPVSWQFCAIFARNSFSAWPVSNSAVFLFGSICYLLSVGAIDSSGPAKKSFRTENFPGDGLIKPDYHCFATDSINILEYRERFFATRTSGYYRIFLSGMYN